MNTLITWICLIGALLFCGCSALVTQRELVTTTPSGALQTNTVTEPSPFFSKAITTGRELAPVIPAPFNSLADLALMLAAAGVGIYARRQNVRASTAEKIADTVIAGVEAVNNPEVKAAVRKTALVIGNGRDVDARVQHVTRNQ
jgi:hypothetical protein